MKKRWKIFWILCAVSGVSGVIFLLISCLVFGVTFQKIDSMMPYGISIGKFEEVEPSEETGEIAFTDWNDSYEDITSLDIDLKAGELKILTSYGESVVVEATPRSSTSISPRCSQHKIYATQNQSPEI